MSLSPRSSALLYRSPRTLAKLTTAAFVPYIAGAAYVGFLLVSLIQYADAVVAGEPVSREAFMATLMSLDEMTWPLHGLRILGIIVFLFWVHRVASNLIRFGEPGDSPGITVASFFIPVVNLWQPLVALSNVWTASDAQRRHVDFTALPPPRKPPLLVAWWTLWLLNVVLTLAATYQLRSVTSPVELASALRWALVATIVDGAALALMLAVVWSLTRRQDERGGPEIPRATIAAE